MMANANEGAEVQAQAEFDDVGGEMDLDTEDAECAANTDSEATDSTPTKSRSAKAGSSRGTWEPFGYKLLNSQYELYRANSPPLKNPLEKFRLFSLIASSSWDPEDCEVSGSLVKRVIFRGDKGKQKMVYRPTQKSSGSVRTGL